MCLVQFLGPNHGRTRRTDAIMGYDGYCGIEHIGSAGHWVRQERVQPRRSWHHDHGYIYWWLTSRRGHAVGDGRFPPDHAGEPGNVHSSGGNYEVCGRLWLFFAFGYGDSQLLVRDPGHDAGRAVVQR